MGVPVKLGAGGIEEIVELDLTDEEQAALEASADAVRDVVGVLGYLAMDLGLEGRTAIVCGASAGMGLAIAEALSAEGANVAMFARRRDELEREAERLGALAVRGDLTNPKDLKRLVEKTIEAFGGIDILVNNSGGPPRTTGARADRRARRDSRRAAAALGDPPHEPLPPPPPAQRKRPDHQHRVQLGPGAARQPRALQLGASGSDRLGEDARPRGRPRRNHGQLDRTGPDRDRAPRARRLSTARAPTRWRRSRCAASAARRRSPR